jgi:predicted permease
VEPRIGRGFRDDEDVVPGRDAVVVLGPDFWKSEFGGDGSVVDKVVRLNGRDFTVIGVAPESFPGMFIFMRPDLYIPLAMARVFSTDPRKDFFVDRDDRELTVRARVKPATTLREARNELALLARGFEREYPKTNRDRGAAVRTQFQMRTQDSDVNWKFSVIFTILALAVLLVACTNAAGLLLARARTRTREIAVRLAIGAGRSRLVRLLLTESLVLALLGGLGGVVLGYSGIRFLTTFQIPSELPVKIPFRMDVRVLIATLAFSVLSAIFCGLAPALQSTRTDVVGGLKTADVDEPGGRRRLWGRNALVVAQIAMSMMLLAASFLMYRGFQNTLKEGIDFAREAKDHVLMAKFDPRLVQYNEARTRHFYELLTERVREAPGVSSVALSQNPPLSLDDFGVVTVVPEGFQMPRDRQHFVSTMDTVDEGFFRTMGVPILRGRGFRASDTADSPRVAVVNEQFARHYWPESDALGRRFRIDPGTPVEIVGIAQKIKYRDSTFGKPMDFVYLPVSQHPVPRMVLLVKSEGDPLQMVQPVKDAVRALDPNMPVLETRTYGDLYRYSAVEGPGIAVELVGTLGAVGLVLAIAGLYGLVAYNVSRRTREIGIRMAIGAQPSDVLRLVMGKGLALVATGTAIGLVLGFGLDRLLNSMVFNAGGIDLTVYLVVVPAMVAATMLAAYVPARKASRIPPTLALRCE